MASGGPTLEPATHRGQASPGRLAADDPKAMDAEFRLRNRALKKERLRVVCVLMNDGIDQEANTMKTRPMGALLLLCCMYAIRCSAAENRLMTNLEAGTKQHIVTYGTSLTAASAWVKQVEQALTERYPELVKVTNSGSPGKHSHWGVQNLQKRVIDLEPDVVLIEFAINDSVAKFNCPLEKAKANLELMITRIQTELPDCVIILQVMNPVIGTKGPAGHRPHLDDYYQMYRDVAAARKLVLVDHAPAWKVVLDQGEDAFHDLVPDSLHPNAEGCKQIITPGILEALSGENAEELVAKPL